jgi:hypothetical protein
MPQNIWQNESLACAAKKVRLARHYLNVQRQSPTAEIEKRQNASASMAIVRESSKTERHTDVKTMAIVWESSKTERHADVKMLLHLSNDESKMKQLLKVEHKN